jgi:hypothetical protein
MSVTRRHLLMAVPAAGAALVLAPFSRSPQSPDGWEAVSTAPSGPNAPNAAIASSASDAAGAAEPVVSFHLDQPYLDLTGLEKPYVPPAGLRSGAPLAALSEEQVLSRFYGFI